MAARFAPLNIVKHAGKRHTGTVIFFHGSGDSSSGIKEWVDMTLGQEMNFPHLKIIYPNAPLRPYTPNGGEMSNVWFDRLNISPDAPEHMETLEDTAEAVKDLISQEQREGILPNRIVVGGFSMGGAVAYHTAFRWIPQLAGVFALSSFLSRDSIIYKAIKKSESLPELLHVHGSSDMLIPCEWGKNTYDQLRNCGVNGSFHVIPKTHHSLSHEGIKLTVEFIKNQLPEI